MPDKLTTSAELSELHERAARWEKIARLAMAISLSQIPLELASTFSREQWRMAAKAGNAFGPSQTTIDLFVRTLQEMKE